MKMENGAADSLVMAISVLRHGDRGPIIFLKNDANRDYWGNQTDVLTNQGKLEAYELGLWYRKYYSNLLPVEYNSNDIYAHSTDSVRCMMTAQCALAAMYPPTESSQWQKYFNWQPIPVHANHDQSYEYEAVIDSFSVGTITVDGCNSKQSAIISTYFKNRPIYDKWRQFYFGDGKYNLKNIVMSLDAVALAINKKLPHQVPPNVDVNILLRNFVEIIQTLCEIHPHGLRLGMKALQFVHKFINERIEENIITKFCLYSGHDINIFALMGLMNISLPRPQYCGFVTFELHKLSDDQHYIKLRFKQNFESDLIDVPIDGQEFCSWQQFQKLFDECQAKVDKANSPKTPNQ